ncbi:MAG: hypothetical protein FJZ93_05375 [Chloroflexi bacterium]|nr:hypothetical protein [Chloroflexota bacterium]MBM4450874.1 hypothetical protein [Chloroflexota bacterium]
MMVIGGLLGLFLGLAGAAAGLFFILYALGVFEYLGGKKRNPNAVSKETLVNKLLALNDPSKPYHIVKGEEADLVAEWKIVDASWYGIFSKNKLSEAYQALLLLDEARRSVRVFEEMNSVEWMAGSGGPVPRVHYRKSFARGRILFKKEWGVGYAIKDQKPFELGKVYEYKFDVDDIRGPIAQVVKENGWEWVPVVARRHATYQ